MIPQSIKNETVAVAMSGGVDSSLSAVLLKREGYDVIGVTMLLWDYTSCGGNIHGDTACCSTDSMNDARAVCQAENIPHFVLDLRTAFRREVVDNFVTEYLAGRTPNPCIRCNEKMKWEVLHTKTRELGATLLATGHYARIVKGTRCLLKTGMDGGKDQSYFLWSLTQEKLRHTLFPLGSMTKDETRKVAGTYHLKVAEKGESQEICFIPDNDYRRFLDEFTTPKNRRTGIGADMQPFGPGPIKDLSGAVLGTHRGYPFYTVGQRKGLGIAAASPLYVIRIDPEKNTLYVGPDGALHKNGLIATDLNWISIEHPEGPMACRAKIRYRHHPASARISPLADGTVHLRFDQPQRAITPGQSVVFYTGDTVIGGGIIERVVDDVPDL